MYTLFFVVGFLIACFMLSSNFEQAVMENVPVDSLIGGRQKQQRPHDAFQRQHCA
jgi:hypothetical protein